MPFYFEKCARRRNLNAGKAWNTILGFINGLDRLAPRTRSAAAGQKSRPLGRGGFTLTLVACLSATGENEPFSGAC
jgi:hypothetical protein